MSAYPKIFDAGEDAVIVYLAKNPCTEVSDQIAAMLPRLREHLGDCLVDLIPSFTSILIIYRPLVRDHYYIHREIRDVLTELGEHEHKDGKLVELPVYYGKEVGWDLERISDRTRIPIDDIIELHQQQEYRVYAIGFSPGFAYMGEVDGRIASARLETPRKKVPQGAVGIADRQTAIYPKASPGGWNIIGRCPTPMFDKTATRPVPVSVGDRVRFYAINKETFLAKGGQL
ncbi:Kinase A inhibitor [Saliniradius amylolyticus]|uniref:Kinase A inhibitor n=1 Tax=Saliniradius amylolyticus TaxID=2183582 RepID=A0A2S2E629_9ALTE|nr:5-oxoprolinase subunit PxpB [Saliniradius amylolyticus]AWL13114.1 Kinase A inhibitor [Saliniradius amylolyticus]